MKPKKIDLLVKDKKAKLIAKKKSLANMVKTDYGNIDKDQYLRSTMMQGQTTVRKFKKWLKIQNKKLGTNFTINDFDKND